MSCHSLILAREALSDAHREACSHSPGFWGQRPLSKHVHCWRLVPCSGYTAQKGLFPLGKPARLWWLGSVCSVCKGIFPPSDKSIWDSDGFLRGLVWSSPHFHRISGTSWEILSRLLSHFFHLTVVSDGTELWSLQGLWKIGVIVCIGYRPGNTAFCC